MTQDCDCTWPWLDNHLFELDPHHFYWCKGGLVKRLAPINLWLMWVPLCWFGAFHANSKVQIIWKCIGYVIITCGFTLSDVGGSPRWVCSLRALNPTKSHHYHAWTICGHFQFRMYFCRWFGSGVVSLFSNCESQTSLTIGCFKFNNPRWDGKSY